MDVGCTKECFHNFLTPQKLSVILEKSRFPNRDFEVRCSSRVTEIILIFLNFQKCDEQFLKMVNDTHLILDTLWPPDDVAACQINRVLNSYVFEPKMGVTIGSLFQKRKLIPLDHSKVFYLSLFSLLLCNSLFPFISILFEPLTISFLSLPSPSPPASFLSHSLCFTNDSSFLSLSLSLLTHPRSSPHCRCPSLI